MEQRLRTCGCCGAGNQPSDATKCVACGAMFDTGEPSNLNVAPLIRDEKLRALLPDMRTY